MTASANFRFSGHQTFVFRYGWLEKGVRMLEQNPDLFSRDDALVLLGVGKNMVDSIRHWCQVAQFTTLKEPGQRNGSRNLAPTELASRLLGQEGWDPFLEDDATLWLIHWLIVTNQQIGTVWQLLFARFNRSDFTRKEFIGYVADFAAKHGLTVADSVLSRDVDCLLRTYVGAADSTKPIVIEESFSCPLLQLGLLQVSPDGELYRFAIGPKPSLSGAVFAYALHEYFERRAGSAETMSVQECLYGEGSPGQVFKLDENSLVQYLEDLEDSIGDNIMLDETAGLKQIYRKKRFDPLAVLGRYYVGGSRK